MGEIPAHRLDLSHSLADSTDGADCCNRIDPLNPRKFAPGRPCPECLGTYNPDAPLLYEVKPTDPPVFGAVVAVLLMVVTLASLAPAISAARVNPAVALRNE